MREQLDVHEVWEILRFRILNSANPDDQINRIVEDWAQKMQASEDLKTLFRAKLVSIACERRYESSARH